jgi:hypothetical protein
VSLELDIADDFTEITDWLREVLVDGQSVSKSLRRAITTKEAVDSGGKYRTSDVAFHFNRSMLADPKIGSQIADDSGTWTVLATEFQTLANRWRCVCRKLSIASGEQVTIQRATYTKGPTGAKEPTWSTLAANVLARVQYLTGEIDTGHASRSTTTTAKVYFAAPQSLQQGDRIITNTNAVLKVLSWEGFNLIESLFAAECEVSKWPQA